MICNLAMGNLQSGQELEALSGSKLQISNCQLQISLSYEIFY